jgi:hypothetical protein
MTTYLLPIALSRSLSFCFSFFPRPDLLSFARRSAPKAHSLYSQVMFLAASVRDKRARTTIGPFKILSAFVCSLGAASALRQWDNTTLQGLTKEGLVALNVAIHKWLDEKNGASVVTLLARHGQIMDHDTYGALCFSNDESYSQKDAIFRIAS